MLVSHKINGDVLQRGCLVEFTDDYHWHYPPEDKSLIKYGVVTEDTRIDSRAGVSVKLADGNTEFAKHIHAYGWIGWMPDNLESVFNELNNYIDDMDVSDE